MVPYANPISKLAAIIRCIMETFSFPKTPAEKAMQTITKTLAPCTVYLFGYRIQNTATTSIMLRLAGAPPEMHHLDFLVFSDKATPNAAADIANMVFERSQGVVTVSLLLHKVTELKTKQVDMQWFFWSVLRDGHRLCLDTLAPPYSLSGYVPVRNAKAVREYWLKCEAVAGLYIESAAESLRLDVERVKISLLHQAVEQLALGLVRVFLGYTPNYFGLGFLLDLCGHFTDLPTKLLYCGTEDRQRRFKLLCAPPSLLRHSLRLETNEGDFRSLLQSCREFACSSAKAANLELERLENQSIAKTA